MRFQCRIFRILYALVALVLAGTSIMLLFPAFLFSLGIVAVFCVKDRYGEQEIWYERTRPLRKEEREVVEVFFRTYDVPRYPVVVALSSKPSNASIERGKKSTRIVLHESFFSKDRRYFASVFGHEIGHGENDDVGAWRYLCENMIRTFVVVETILFAGVVILFLCVPFGMIGLSFAGIIFFLFLFVFIDCVETPLWRRYKTWIEHGADAFSALRIGDRAIIAMLIKSRRESGCVEEAYVKHMKERVRSLQTLLTD